MIKYTILYKNGKTWNGKVKYFSDVPATDCLCVIFREGDTVYATTPYQHMVTGWHWNTPKFVGYSLTGYTRTPNPKSKTKKQKALEDGYHRWVRDWHHRGSSDITMQAYKKWLFHQRLEEHLTEVAGALPEYKVALYTNADEPKKITFPSGASVSFHDSKDVLKGCKECYVSHEPWDGVYKPWKEAKLSIPDYPLPIKTTYSFWLGAFGEVADD